MSEQRELDLTPGTSNGNGAGNPQTIGEAVDAIRRDVLTEREKGTRFEALVRPVLPTLPE